MSRLSILNIALLSLLCSAAASSTQNGRWYQVEVIVFAHINNTAVLEEYWPPVSDLPDMSGAVSIATDMGAPEYLPGGQVKAFGRLPIQVLSRALSRLQNSSRYRIIHATAWAQPGLPEKSASPVRIQAGRRYAIPPTIPGVSALPVFTPAEQATGFADNVLYELDGRIKVSLSRYLDVDTDLVFRDNALPSGSDSAAQSFHAFRLTEFRRMKSSTIHYLDHPIFGVVISIEPLQSVAADEVRISQPGTSNPPSAQ